MSKVLIDWQGNVLGELPGKGEKEEGECGMKLFCYVCLRDFEENDLELCDECLEFCCHDCCLKKAKKVVCSKCRGIAIQHELFPEAEVL